MRTTRDLSGTEGSSVAQRKRLFAFVGRDVRQDGSRNKDSGAALVEMAMVLGLLVMLLVGVVTSAIAFGQQNSIENAAREGSRYGATLPFDSDWLTTVRNVTRAAAQGNLDATVPGSYICVARIIDSSIPDVESLVDTGGSVSEPGTVCFDDGRPDDEVRVQVVTGRDSEIQAVFFNVDLDLEAPAAARYERD